MKKLLFVLALMLVGLSPALAQTKVMYAEITETVSGDPSNLTLTFKAVDADKVPAENYDATTGVGTYVLSNNRPSYAKIKGPSPTDKDICYYIKKAVFDTSVADARPTSTAYWLLYMVNLTTVEGIENLNTSEVTSMNRMFWLDRSLKVLDVSKFNTAKVTNMSSMFSGCSSLSNLDVSNFNTTNVTDMSAMFSGCSSLSKLDVSKFNTANVTDMRAMFYGCSSLTSLEVSNFNTGTVTDMKEMFAGCSSLTSLDVSKFNTANVTDMSYMFQNCKNLTSIDVSNFKTENVTDTRSMFNGCSSLTSIDVSKFNTANVTDMNAMFVGCKSLTSIDVSKFNTGKVTNMYNMFKDCSSLSSLDVSKFDTGNVKDMSAMFSGCKSLTSLDVTNFDTHNVRDMYSMFNDCSSLTELDVSKFNTVNVVTMYNMFNNCSKLPRLDVSKFNTGKVDRLNYMFAGCGSLTSLDVTSFNTAKVTSMRNMFAKCTKLSSIDVNKFDVQNVTEFAYMFSDCSNLDSLDISNWTINANSINSNQYSNGVRSFANGCKNLTELNLGDNDFSAVKSNDYAFDVVGKAQPCHITFTFDRSSLGDVTIDKKNSLPPYYNYLRGRFTIAEKLDCDKNLAEDYTPVAKANTDLWQPNRQFTTNDWNTLVVPVALTREQLEQSFGTGVQVCRLVSYSDKKLYYKTVGAKESIPANEPVLVKPAEDIKNIGYGNVNIEVPTNNLTNTVTSGATSVSFIGTYKSKLTLDDRSWLFYSPSWQAFVCSDGTAFIRKTRAYVKITGAPVNSLSIAIDEDGVTNDIDRIDGEAIGQPEGPAYNLSGQRVGDDYKGIVIVNGKKLLRK